MIRSQIVALPRGYRWTHRGRSFVSFGGAIFIDFEFRRLGRSWWMEELPTVEEGADLAAGGHGEIMVSHVSPAPGTPLVNRIRATPNGWSGDALAYADVGARRITAAWAQAGSWPRGTRSPRMFWSTGTFMSRTRSPCRAGSESSPWLRKKTPETCCSSIWTRWRQTGWRA